MSLTRSIPVKMREEMSKDKFYSKCCLADEECEGRIEFHHNLQYAGKRVNEKFCILPVCSYHHSRADTSIFKERMNYQMLNRANDEELKRYSKAVDYLEYRRRLNIRYGKPRL